MRPYNFSAGPAAIPLEVLERAAKEMSNWHGCGMGVMEMSHRGKEFISIYEHAESNFRALLSVPLEFKILFMQPQYWPCIFLWSRGISSSLSRWSSDCSRNY